ncbi:MAG: beta-lactamase family protein [Anaerolineae bacterium]|nr:beta-lactamase family protein [Anaerolineae bacterium]
MKSSNHGFTHWLLRVVVVVLTLIAIRAPLIQAQPVIPTLESYVKAQMQAMNLPGVALGIVQGDQIVHLEGYGVTDPTGHPVTPQTSFRLASVSKTLTALAVMQLVEAGKLDLDAPVQHYLPWFRLADEQISAKITLRHLLYHTSGIPQTAGYDNFYNGDYSDTALENNVRHLESIASTSPAGSTYQYANLNYDTLGLIIQSVSGHSYETYIQDHIFTPLAMQHSFTSQTEALDQGMATGYRRWFGIPIAANLPDDRATRPSSFLISSAEDMAHFLIAELNSGRYGDATLLSPQSMAEMRRPFIPIGTTGLYSAMGLDVDQVNGEQRLAKTGGTANYYARIVLLPDSGWGVVVLANSFDIGLAEQFDTFADQISTWLLDQRPLDIIHLPIGGGNTPMKVALLAVIILELVFAFRMKIVLTPNRFEWRSVIRKLLKPLALDIIIALVVLLTVPRLMNTPFSFLYYFAPDIFWLLVAIVTIPIVKDVFKTLITLRRLSIIQAI